MGWQERERNIPEALKVIKNQQILGTRPGSRVHIEGMTDRAAKMLALEQGDCHYCLNLIIEIKETKGRKGVALRCLAGKSPLDLHRPYVYELGKTPKCPSLDFSGEKK